MSELDKNTHFFPKVKVAYPKINVNHKQQLKKILYFSAVNE